MGRSRADVCRVSLGPGQVEGTVRIQTYGDRALRRATAPLRHYPSFVIIGGIRCGTTSLIRYLSEHPEVDIATTKEPHYFDWNHERGDNWYRSFFSLRSGAAKIAGESSPAYLMDPEAPKRAAAAMPDGKLLLLVRNPVERAHSHYRYRRQRGHEDAPTFEEALADEPRRGSVASEGRRRAWTLPRYFHHGLYADGLSRWLEHFPQDQVHVIKSEDFYADTAKHFTEVLEFLGVTQYELGDFAVHNAAAGSSIDPGTRAQLFERYAEPNQLFYELIGADLGWE